MIIQFKTVRGSLLESINDELSVLGIDQENKFNELDYISSIYLEMNKVIDFTVDRTLINDKEVECIYPITEHIDGTPNLLISEKDFVKIFEYAKNTKIQYSNELLIKLENENYTKGF